jgi:hypothetical protein
MNIFL